ncbi:MAG: hypothetical protein M0R80_21980 [Proteobacteria bacterium]|jgi:hypothetical protein|nr:hypothetical protein [Pseudomonadota bacterium]
MNKSSTRRALASAGAILERIHPGHLGLAAGAGVLVGFWLADSGVRFLPTAVGAVLVTVLAGFLAVILSRVLQGTALEDTAERRRVRKRVLAVGAIAVAAATLRLVVFWMESPSPLTQLSEDDFDAAFEIDTARYRELEGGMERAVAFLEAPRAMFDAAVPGVLTAEEERQLLATWRALYETGFALDQLRVFYEDWFRFDPSRAERSRHLRGFLLAYAAELSLYEKATRATLRIRRNENAVKFLNAPHPGEGLGADTFSFFRQELQGTRDKARIEAGAKYLAFLERAFRGRAEARGLGLGWLWDVIEGRLAALRATAPLRKTALGVESDLELIKRPARRNWYPTQKKAAELMGDTKVRRIGRYLISREQQERVDQRLEPGDILLARKNWYLSNVGLPGFWPHAILYLGDPQKLAAFGGAPEVVDYVERISGKRQPLTSYLAAAHPRDWAAYSRGSGRDPFRVIEAVSEGVVFNTMDHVAGDYLVALRPRLGAAEKARAIVEAFGHLGKPYDFEFDFATDHALVCTELVWRSYRPDAGMRGLRVALVEMMGRETLPANEIARLYAKERGRPDAQLEFVLFLDAREAEGRAVVSDEAAFAATPDRTKWDVAQR